MKIGVASDHAGFKTKSIITRFLVEQGYQVEDFGTKNEKRADYPDYGHPLAEAIETQNCDLGIAVCGSGNGINMTVNKHQGIRAALCWNKEIAQLAREHNDANICTLPGRYINEQEAMEIVSAFLSAEFDGGRHLNRIKKIPIKSLSYLVKKSLGMIFDNV